MKNVSTELPPVIDYASPEPRDGNAFLRPMMRWRSRCGWCVVAMLLLMGLAMLWPPISFLPEFLQAGTGLCLIGMLITSIFTLIYLGRAAMTEVSAGYAARQVILAVLLTPIFLLGVFVMPILVQSDLLKWRRVEERKTLTGLAASAAGQAPNR
jgi:hypothetical protein